MYSEENKVYRGECWNCEPYGFGQLTSERFKYIGEFKNGDFDGFGKMEKLTGCTVYDG